MSINKNEEYLVDIIDNGYEGEGVAKIDGITIFIPGAIKEEKCKIVITKVNSSHAYGKILEIIRRSDKRIDTDCNTYKRCGGCNLRHIKYETTLLMKKNIVQNLVNKYLENNIIVRNTIGMKDPHHYRNKAQFPLGYDKENKPVFGVYANRTHEVIPIIDCKIQHKIAQNIANTILEFINKYSISIYNEKTCRGLFRHIVVKVGVNTNEIMCMFVLNEKQFNLEKDLVDILLKEYPDIKTIVKNINSKNTNVILGDTNIVLYGDGYIYDKLGDYTFKISPKSFYQTNPTQTEILYNIAIEKSNLKKEDIVLDLYCGIGTIGIFASKYVKMVYGIEKVEDAVKDAKDNANINNIKNIEFRCGDVETILDSLLNKDKIIPNVVFIDPPRKGIDDTTISNLKNLSPQKIIYISCNPSTMIRDLHKLEEQYNIVNIQPIDMFPYTSHIETVTILAQKNQGL